MGGKTDRHDYDLGAILEDGSSRPSPAKGTRGKLLLGMLLGAGLLALGFHLLQGAPQPAHPDLSDAVGLSAELSTLIDVRGDWIGTVRDDWAGASTPRAAEQACQDLAQRAGLRTGEILTLMTSSGTTLAECER